MRFLLFIYLFSQLLAVFALANEADQIVLGNLQTLKLFEPTPTTSPEMDPIGTKDVNWSTQDETISPPQTAPFSTATSGSGSGGGATCVQGCLARAASQVGCGSSANFWCVCKKGAYVGKAWDCFGQSGCPGSDIGKALGDLKSACRSFSRLAASADEGPESPMVTPEGTPAVVLGSSRYDEL
ncbi:CFEM domain protein [Rhizoctonia solani 123E]|uniref:CFEM domain protein n=1 Tax=Rhizoctonia solani 123E TaxID=1423351 RepID=A0A074RIR0_9AGAM|nr:CFEM domain protein [Rhizoctonia solani 123E]